MKRVRFTSYLGRCPDAARRSELLSELIRCELRNRPISRELLKSRLHLFRQHEQSESEWLALVRGVYGDRVEAGTYPTMSDFDFLGQSFDQLQLKTEEEVVYLGQVIANQYRVDQRLGKGSFGIVYRGTNLQTDKAVALKTTRISGDDPEQMSADFLKQEADLLATLHGAHIPRRIEFVEFHPGQWILIRAFVEGITLSNLIKLGPVDPVRAAKIVRRLAETLQFLHRRGFLHRDLSPSNILVDKEDTPYLTDFGLGVSQAALLDLGPQAAGTRAYMTAASRMGWSKEIDERDDIFSLGVILYELLTGSTAREFTDDMFTRGRQLTNALSEYRSQIPKRLILICMRCLSDNPDSRYETASLLARKLRAFLALKQQDELETILLSMTPEQKKRIAYAKRRFLVFRAEFWSGAAFLEQNHAQQRLRYLNSQQPTSNDFEAASTRMIFDIKTARRYVTKCNRFVQKLGFGHLPVPENIAGIKFDDRGSEANRAALKAIETYLHGLQDYLMNCVQDNLDRFLRTESLELCNLGRLGFVIGAQWIGPNIYQTLTKFADRANLPPGCIDRYIVRASTDITSSEHETDSTWARKTIERQLRNDLADELERRQVVMSGRFSKIHM